MKIAVVSCLISWLASCSDTDQPIASLPAGSEQLSAGICPLIHCDREQSDAFDVSGPSSPSRRLTDEEIDFLWSSPIAGGILDYIYDDGQRVFFVPQVDRIMKLALDENNNWSKLAELPLTPKDYPRFSPQDMQRFVADLDNTELNTAAYEELTEYWDGYQVEGLRAYYAMVNNAGILYVSNRNGIVAYADIEPGNPNSAIEKIGQYNFERSELQLGLKMPLVILIGLNITHDGHLVAVTIDGTVIAIEPDLSDAVYHRLDGEQIWNSVAIDENNAIYVNGNKAMHKLIWDGKRLSDDSEAGAWRVTYELGEYDSTVRGNRGSGTTPALMSGANDRDRFVVSADSANVNQLMLYWRDEIPPAWQQLPGTSSRRVAGILPVNFGDPDLDSSYSECSATIFDGGVVLANNQSPSNEQMTLDTQLKMKDPARTPLGIQKFQWNSAKQTLEVAWTRKDVSSPNSVPVVSKQNRQLHVVGIHNGEWALQTLDWDTGQTREIYPLGASERFNPIMLALQLLPNGEPIFPAFGGMVHLKID